MTAWCKTDKGITASYRGKIYNILSTNPKYGEIIELIKAKEWESAIELLDVAQTIEKKSDGAFSVRDGLVYVKGEDRPLPEVLSKRVLDFYEEGLDYAPLLKFWGHVKLNPSNRAVDRLYECLEHNHHPITEDGNFLAYKKVRQSPDGNLYDIYTYRNDKGTFLNNVGLTVTIQRNLVDENIDQTCSYGLHVASYDYAARVYGSDSDVLLEVEVNPKDVVAIPRDYNNQKMRVCAYKVLAISAGYERTEAYVGYDQYEDEDEEEAYWDDHYSYLYGDYDEEY
jgi:hypothetical protein